MNKLTYTVEHGNTRSIKQILRNTLSFSGRLMTKIKQGGAILLNGTPVKTYIIPSGGDVIEIQFPQENSGFTPEKIPVIPVYEDAHLLIIDKPAGFVVHPTKGHPAHTMANGVMQYLLDSGQNFKIRFVNRLDMDTSGLLIIAKNSHTQHDLIQQMHSDRLQKKYTAVVKGIVPDDCGEIALPIGRPDSERPERAVMETGHPSVTHYTVKQRFSKGYTLLELLLETGRTHQIRVHLSHLGYPIVGDHLYGGENVLLIERQALHASSLSFQHPVTGETVYIEAPLPQDMKALIQKLQ